jgi:hypothetical protein
LHATPPSGSAADTGGGEEEGGGRVAAPVVPPGVATAIRRVLTLRGIPPGPCEGLGAGVLRARSDASSATDASDATDFCSSDEASSDEDAAGTGAAGRSQRGGGARIDPRHDAVQPTGTALAAPALLAAGERELTAGSLESCEGQGMRWRAPLLERTLLRLEWAATAVAAAAAQVQVAVAAEVAPGPRASASGREDVPPAASDTLPMAGEATERGGGSNELLGPGSGGEQVPLPGAIGMPGGAGGNGSTGRARGRWEPLGAKDGMPNPNPNPNPWEPLGAQDGRHLQPGGAAAPGSSPAPPLTAVRWSSEQGGGEGGGYPAILAVRPQAAFACDKPFAVAPNAAEAAVAAVSAANAAAAVAAATAAKYPPVLKIGPPALAATAGRGVGTVSAPAPAPLAGGGQSIQPGLPPPPSLPDWLQNRSQHPLPVPAPPQVAAAASPLVAQQSLQRPAPPLAAVAAMVEGARVGAARVAASAACAALAAREQVHVPRSVMDRVGAWFWSGGLVGLLENGGKCEWPGGAPA